MSAVAATRLNLECFERAAVGLRKLEVSAAVKVVAVMTGLSLGSFERVAATPHELEAKLHFVVFGRVVARPCKLAVAAVLSLAGSEQAAAVTTGLGLSGLEWAMAKLNTRDFEWATAGLGELGTRATAVGLNSDSGTWGQLKRGTWWRARTEDLWVDWALMATKSMSLAKRCQ